MLSFVAAVVLVLAVIFIDHAASDSNPGCDAKCQAAVAATDVAHRPSDLTPSAEQPAPQFDYATSTCADWNTIPGSDRIYWVTIIAGKLGAANPRSALQHSMDKAISTVCASYPNDKVKSIAAGLVAIDTSWPNA